MPPLPTNQQICPSKFITDPYVSLRPGLLDAVLRGQTQMGLIAETADFKLRMARSSARYGNANISTTRFLQLATPRHMGCHYHRIT